MNNQYHQPHPYYVRDVWACCLAAAMPKLKMS